MKLQELSTKQRDFLLHSDARVNIACGAVRSGKTLVSVLRWLYLVATCPEGSGLLMCAKTERTLRRNILDLIAEIVGPDDFDLRSGVGECYIFGKKVYLVGANDERSENKIRGITLYAAYLDEVSLYPESFFQMLLSRLSVQGALLIATTNPGSPRHYIKTKFIDRANELNLKYWHFTFDDNLTLSEEFKADIKREYVPGTVWHKRMVLGLWAAAEGSIYDMFTEENVVHDLPAKWHRIIVGVDFGISTVTTYLSVGLAAEGPNAGKWIVFKEFYYDAEKKQRQKTTSELSQDLKTFLERDGGRWYPESIEVDPSASPLKVQFRRDGLSPIHDADNGVKAGIMAVGNALASKRLLIHDSCTNLLEEIPGYVWDTKAQEIGEDAPVKENDHALDALRYAFQRINRKYI